MRFAFSPYRFSLVLFHSFFFLIRIYACPSSHLTNYLLMWNTFLCGCLLFSCIFFLFPSASIVCLRRLPPARIHPITRAHFARVFQRGRVYLLSLRRTERKRESDFAFPNSCFANFVESTPRLEFQSYYVFSRITSRSRVRYRGR